MKTKLSLLFVLATLLCRAQFAFTTIDSTTPTTNTVSSQGFITVTNLASVYVASVHPITNNLGYVTNVSLTLGTNWFYGNWYFSSRTGVVQYGDAPITATFKINQGLTNASLAISNLQTKILFTNAAPTVANYSGAIWCSNGFWFATGNTNGSSQYTKPLAP